MDPKSAELALKLQLRDVNNILKTTTDRRERAAFLILRDELVRKNSQAEGQYMAMQLLRRDYHERGQHQQLLAEERQAQGDHVVASQLAGMAPAHQPALPATAPLNLQRERENGVGLPLTIDLGVMQTDCATAADSKKQLAKNDDKTQKDKTAGSPEQAAIDKGKRRESVCQSDTTPDIAVEREEAIIDLIQRSYPLSYMQARFQALARRQAGTQEDKTREDKMQEDKTAGCQGRASIEKTKGRDSVCQSDATPDMAVKAEDAPTEAAKPVVETSSILRSKNPEAGHRVLSRAIPRTIPRLDGSRAFLSKAESDKPAIEKDDQIATKRPSASSVDKQAKLEVNTILNGEINNKASQRLAHLTECSGCCEEFRGTDILELSCPPENASKHAYCRDCLKSMFEMAIADSDQFPPRCCDPLQLFQCMPFLSEGLIAKFQEKKEELETPNRTYCSKAKCTKWIKLENIKAGVATCSKCAQKTCTSCGAKQHKGLCPDDEHVKSLLTLAEEKRWKSCPECKNMVELAVGCYHVTYVIPYCPSEFLGLRCSPTHARLHNTMSKLTQACEMALGSQNEN
ncbi:hypothetical protein SLS60_005277 [Paraconiothyrium brasiliense]|uniref:RBR-type E3 ubiquitin transferase n=1 Tax=Paraconiothyrium brasiliense TaxID=300254 RepID=A0ABR3RHM0_9PLEO